jgi:parallel beta-helix repeat protein
VTGNSQETDLGYDGIELENADQNVIQDNTVRMGSGDNRHSCGVRIEQSDYNSVLDNDLTGSGATGGVCLYGASYTIVAGNSL